MNQETTDQVDQWFRQRYGTLDDADCQRVKWHILHQLDSPYFQSSDSVHLVRKLLQTGRCRDDRLGHLRSVYVRYLGLEASGHDSTSQPDPERQLKQIPVSTVHRATRFYQDWTRSEVEKSLSWSAKLWYQKQRLWYGQELCRK